MKQENMRRVSIISDGMFYAVTVFCVITLIFSIIHLYISGCIFSVSLAVAMYIIHRRIKAIFHDTV